MTREEILSMARESGFVFYDMHDIDGQDLGETVEADDWAALERFAEVVLQRERTARQAAQQQLADLQELHAKSGLAHRMAVQRAVQYAVSEAVADERASCMLVCEKLPAPDSCTGVERSLWDVATMACADAIRARGSQ